MTTAIDLHPDYSVPKRRSKAWRWLLAASLPACFLFWFFTAPAGMAVQRITAGNNGPFSRLIICATEAYESPMAWFCKFRAGRQFYDSASDWWCDVLDAPETTP